MDEHSDGSGAQGAIDQVKDMGANLADQASNMTGSVIDQAKQSTASQFDSQRQSLAGTMNDTASALRHTGQQLRDSDQANIAGFVDMAAERLEGFGRYLNERRLDDLVSDAESFARREPGIFLTAAFGAGLFAARFLKSSKPQQSTGQYSGGRRTYSGMYPYGGATGYDAERRMGATAPPAASQTSRRPSQPRTAGTRQPEPRPGEYAGAGTSARTNPAGTAAPYPNGHGGQSDWNQG